MTNFHISSETEDLRNNLLLSEFEYIDELTKKPGFAEYYKTYRGEDIDVLTNKLLSLYKMMDEGKIREED